MRKRNKVAQLNKPAGHRNAMLGNLVASLIYHERITSTVAKVKAARSIAEKLITKAKNGQQPEKKVHNIRNISKVIKDQEIVDKLVNDVAPRFMQRAGGYTRIIKTGQRPTDRSEMAILELVDRKDLVVLKEDRKKVRATKATGKTQKAKESGKDSKKEAKKAG